MPRHIEVKVSPLEQRDASSFEVAVRRFQNVLKKHRVIDDYKKTLFFLKPSEQARREKEIQNKRAKRKTKTEKSSFEIPMVRFRQHERNEKI